MQDNKDQGNITEVSASNMTTSKRYNGRVASANPNSRSHRMASVSSHDGNFAGGALASQTSSVFNTTVVGGMTTRNQPAQISSEVHMRQNQNSNKSLVNVSSSGQINHDTKSLSQVQSDPKIFSSANTRRKLPIGFLVQQEKRELHKMGMQTTPGSTKMRPDSAKVTVGQRSRHVLLSNDV